MEYIHYFVTTPEFIDKRENDYDEPWVSYTESGEKVHYNKRQNEKFLTFNIVSAGSLNWYATSTAGTKTIQYKKNNGEWEEITSSTGGTEIPVSAGDKIQVKGNNNSYASNLNLSSFSGSTAYFNIEGNIMSLIDETGYTELSAITASSAFTCMFECTNVISAEKLVLPAENTYFACYYKMFAGCTALTIAPLELPSTSAWTASYYGMFSGCTNLVSAPKILAKHISSSACSSMFEYCESLTAAPELPATVIGRESYYNMFRFCSSLVNIPRVLPAGTAYTRSYACMFQGCPITDMPEIAAYPTGDFSFGSMFADCTNLTGVTYLNLNRVSYGCCQSLFARCTSLTGVPIDYLPAESTASWCYHSMFAECTNLVAPPDLPFSGTIQYDGYMRMFAGCINLEHGPDINAKGVYTGACSNMFSGCTKLNYVKLMVVEINSTTHYNSFQGFLEGVSPTGTFVKNASATWADDNGIIPDGWTIVRV